MHLAMIDENTNEESKVTSINTGREQLMVNFELGTLGSSDKNNTPKPLGPYNLGRNSALT